MTTETTPEKSMTIHRNDVGKPVVTGHGLEPGEMLMLLGEAVYTMGSKVQTASGNSVKQD